VFVCYRRHFDDFGSCLMSSLLLIVSGSSPISVNHPPIRLNIQQAVSSQNDHRLLSLIHQHPPLIPRSESPPSIPSILAVLNPFLRVYAQLSFLYSSCFGSSTPCTSFLPFVLLSHLVRFSPLVPLVQLVLSFHVFPPESNLLFPLSRGCIPVPRALPASTFRLPSSSKAPSWASPLYHIL
jgi:hypothetical protein